MAGGRTTAGTLHFVSDAAPLPPAPEGANSASLSGVDELCYANDSGQALDYVPPDLAADILRLYDRDAANAWLAGQHPLLGHRSPLSELAHGRIAEVRAALRSDAADSFA